MLEIQGNPKGYIDVKRFSIPGLRSIETCPNCGERSEQPLPYFRDPVIGEWFNETLYCVTCDHEWDVSIRINIEVEVKN